MLRTDHGSLYLIETFFFFIYMSLCVCLYKSCDMPKGRKKAKIFIQNTGILQIYRPRFQFR